MNNNNFMDALGKVECFVCDNTPESCLVTAALMVLNDQRGFPVVLGPCMLAQWKEYAASAQHKESGNICLVGFGGQDISGLLAAIRETGDTVALAVDPELYRGTSCSKDALPVSPYGTEDLGVDGQSMAQFLFDELLKKQLLSRDSYAAALLRAAQDPDVLAGKEFKLLSILCQASDALEQELSRYLGYLVCRKFAPLRDFWKNEETVWIASLFASRRHKVGDTGMVFEAPGYLLGRAFLFNQEEFNQAVPKVLERNGLSSLLLIGGRVAFLPGELPVPVATEALYFTSHGWDCFREDETPFGMVLCFLSKELSEDHWKDIGTLIGPANISQWNKVKPKNGVFMTSLFSIDSSKPLSDLEGGIRCLSEIQTYLERKGLAV